MSYHILEKNKSLVFLFGVLLLALIIKNTGIVEYIRNNNKENFTDSEKNFIRNLVKEESKNGSATKANNKNVSDLMEKMGKKEITPSGTPGNLDMSMMKSMKDFMQKNGGKMKAFISNNSLVSKEQKEQFSQAMSMLDKLNV
jgi:hypothetical protein